MLDAAEKYNVGFLLLLEPSNYERIIGLLYARVLVIYTAATVSVLFANLTDHEIVIQKN